MFGSKSIYISNEPVSTYRFHSETKTAKNLENFANDIANILNSLCQKVGLKKYTNLLKSIFPIYSHYEFTLPININKIELVERMVIFFSVEMENTVYNKNDFNSVIRIGREIDFNKFDLTEIEKYWLKRIMYQTIIPSWKFFRLRRKIFSIVYSLKMKLVINYINQYSNKILLTDVTQ